MCELVRFQNKLYIWGMELGRQLYPTPDDICRKMVWKLTQDNRKAVVLEPSAGTGALLTRALGWLSRTGSPDADRRRVLACEIDPFLYAGLAAQGWRMMGMDFLQYEGRPDITAIIANPPFDAGAQHLLHAWKILHGGELVFLLNSETILNPCNGPRKLVTTLIERHGSVDHLGRVFMGEGVQRRAQVECSIVYLKKVPREQNYFEGVNFDKHGPQGNVKDAELIRDLSRPDFLQSRVDLYNATVKAYDEALPYLFRAAGLADIVLGGISRAVGVANQERVAKGLAVVVKTLLHKNEDTRFSNDTSPTEAAGRFRDILTEAAWVDFINAMQVRDKLTEGVRKEFDLLRARQGGMAFTVENCLLFMRTLENNTGRMAEAAVLESFDWLTTYHDGNREEIKGWKTNDAYRVRQKFILPRIYGYNGVRGEVHGKLADLDKAVEIVTGRKLRPIETNFETMAIIQPEQRLVECMQGRYKALREGRHVSTVNATAQYDGESGFFKFAVFAGTGTAHFWFKNKKDWEAYNHAVAVIRGWIAPKSADHNDTGTKWKRR